MDKLCLTIFLANGVSLGWDHFLGGPVIWRRGREFHRLDGPAIVWPDETVQWYINGWERPGPDHPDYRAYYRGAK